MYIEYKGRLYRLIRNIMYEDELIMTHFEEKTDHTFFEISDYYAKEYKVNDADVKNIYEVDFYVVYHDTSKTMEMVAQRIKASVEEGRDPEDYKDELFNHRWQVNENHAYHYGNIEKNEVSIVLNADSYSEDWVMVDRGFCSKIVDIYDCEKLLVRYIYSVRDGKALAEKEVVEVAMEPEDFKAEMLKYRSRNI